MNTKPSPETETAPPPPNRAASRPTDNGPTTKTATTSPQGLSSELDWFPSVDKPLNQLESVYSGIKDPAQRNFTLSNIAYLYDAKLFVLFQDMLDFLTPEAQSRELKEQNAWLNKRKSLMTAAFLKYDDAQQARLAAAQAFIDATRARIAEVDKRRKLVVIH